MKERINKIIKEMAFLEQDPEEGAALKEDMGLDSLKAVELIISLEDEFCIQIDDGDLDPSQIKTVGDIYLLIGKYCGETGNAV